jgi:TetR/AcrR family transcriptional repressor of mexJK operon
MFHTAAASGAHTGPDAESSPKRRQIVAAAEELFLAQGYGAVSMELVARTALVSKATLYAYFASKEALFATIVRDKGLETPLSADMFPEDVTDLRAALEALGQRLIHFMLRERTLAIYRIALAEAGRFPELGEAFYDAGPRCMRERFAAWLVQLQAQGKVAVVNNAVAAEQFMALVRSDVFLRRSLSVPPAPTEADIVASVRAAVETWLRAYAANRT